MGHVVVIESQVPENVNNWGKTVIAGLETQSVFVFFFWEKVKGGTKQKQADQDEYQEVVKQWSFQ